MTRASARSDGNVAVAILMYKAVNKAAPSKGAPRIATLVIRGPSAATLQGRRHRGSPPTSAAPAHRPGWPVAFPALVTPLPAMDRVHGLPLYCAPSSFLRRHVVTLPAQMFGGEEARDAYKRRRSPFGQRVQTLVGSQAQNPISKVSNSHC